MTLTPDKQNANKGTDRGRDLLKHSLAEYGAGRSILVDKNGNIIAGNKTFEQASAMGMKVREIETDGDELVVVKRNDLDLYNGTKARELAYADNRVAELDLAWEAEQLAADLEAGIDLNALGFNSSELEDIFGSKKLKDAKPKIDQAEELNKKWNVKQGDLWQIGRHRLLCGDSTLQQDVARLLNHASPNLMVTDPPYGVNYDPSWRHSDGDNERLGLVMNDDQFDWSIAYALSPANVFYIWHGAIFTHQVAKNIFDVGFDLRAQIIWAKLNFVISRGHYHWRHESCWYAVRKGCNASWIGNRKQSTVVTDASEQDVDGSMFMGMPDGSPIYIHENQTTVWDIGKDATAKGGHSTQKPLMSMYRPIRNHEGDVYDPFVGSGTTMVAAENLNRSCYANEKKPAYCAVTLERMSEAFPELEIRRMG